MAFARFQLTSVEFKFVSASEKATEAAGAEEFVFVTLYYKSMD